jgi:hypothetical protein
MARRADYECSVCGHVVEMVGDYPTPIAQSCEHCHIETRVFHRIWGKSSTAAIIIPPKWNAEKKTKGLTDTPRIHTFA